MMMKYVNKIYFQLVALFVFGDEAVARNEPPRLKGNGGFDDSVRVGG